MAKVGSSTDRTWSSSCLAKVGKESEDSQSSPDSLRTHLTWVVTRVEWYQHS